MIPSRQSSLLSYVIYIVGLHVCISTFGLDLLFWLVCVLLHKKCFVVTKWGIFWERLLMLPEVFVFDGCLMKGGSRFHYYNTILSKSMLSLVGRVAGYFIMFLELGLVLTNIRRIHILHAGAWIYRQSPVKNHPINHKVDNFHVLTKSSPQHERNLNKSKSSQFIPKENIKVLCDNYYDQANKLKLRQWV